MLPEPTLITIQKSIQKLPKLHLLHLRISYIQGLGDPRVLSMQMQRFANQFFGDMKRFGRCPQLKALVVGHLCTRMPTEGIYHVPMHCYVRAEQTDVLNRTVSVGVPVSRAMLRATQPYTSILDFDYMAGPWEQWAGRVNS
jgi:hypothetical protein